MFLAHWVSLRHYWKPCGDDDESINHKVHLLVEYLLTLFWFKKLLYFLLSLWCYWFGITSCLRIWKDSSANISRSPFIKLSVYSIRFVIIKTSIKKIFISTISPFLMMTNLFWINLKFYGCIIRNVRMFIDMKLSSP